VTINSILSILIAPFIGSFLGVVIDRLPEGRSILWGRSACDHCGRPLSPSALIPLISYAAQRGRCKNCGVRFSPFYPLIELAALAIAISAALSVSSWTLWISLYLGWSLLVLAIIDARLKILPDAINLPLIPAGLLGITILSPASLPDHIIGTVAGFLTLATVGFAYRQYRGRDGLGLGDAKLFAAAGAWLGWQALPGLLLIAALMALTVALARSAIKGRLEATDELAFGPYLALALWGGWLLGPVILP